MNNQHAFRRVGVALMLLVAFLLQGTWALAGTTGGLSGQVTDDNGAPVAGATVRVASPSESASSKTDSTGHYAFLSLAPDTYTVSVEKDGFSPTSYAGATVFADQQFTVALKLSKSLKQIAKVTARSAGSLVKAGTTSDVYSVNAATQQTVQGLGGGYNLDSAYSAVYSQPGVTSQIGDYGFGQVFYIRGSSYSQVGYEYDGVPVNRAFDNYNANSLTSLGSQETQVYTGGSPAGGASATLAGYINQVIKTGTYPGYGQATLGGGYPTFYHKVAIEAGGATPDRLFSYYAGFSGADEDYRFQNNKNFDNFAQDGSNPYGLSSGYFNAGATLGSLYYGNGPWSSCGAGGVQPSGAATFGGLPTCNYYYPFAAVGTLSFPVTTNDRENIMNFHFGVPHKNDGGRDDLQLLFYNFSYKSIYGDSLNDSGGMNAINQAFNGYNAILGGGSGPYADYCSYQGLLAGFGIGTGCATTGNSPLSYSDGHTFAPGTHFGQDASTAQVVNYYAPGSSTNRPLFDGVDPNNRDALFNNGSIVKLQYQKNIGSNAFVRMLGYTFYSDWLQTAANSGNSYNTTAYGAGFAGYGYPSPDYELNTHSRGLQLDAEDQINSKNLVKFIANYTTASANRWNNAYYAVPFATNLVSGNQCYSASSGNPASCLSRSSQGSYTAPTRGWTTNSACANLPGTPACTAGAQFLVTVPGGYGNLNKVQPKFMSLALEDEFRPSDRLNLDLGVRFERYAYDLANTNNPEYSFWFNQAANSYCYDPATGQPVLSNPKPGTPPSQTGPIIDPNTVAGQQAGMCYQPGTLNPYVAPSGQQAQHPLNFTNLGAKSLAHSSFSPRVSGTYTFNPDTVVRFSAGRYTQPTNTAYEQYANASGAGAAKFDFTHFYGLGFNTPVHDNAVQTSNNYDFSLEKHLKGTDMSVKISPFYRYTTNQIVTVALGSNFASGINAGTQKSSGIELAIQKGDPSRNGLSGQLSYTYTKAKMKFNTLANGSNTIDVLNSYINAYNQLAAGSPYYCGGTTGGPNGSNTPAASAAACATPIANPYFGAAQQRPLDRNGWYDVYANNPPYTSPDGVLDTAISPNTFAGYLNYKHNKLTVSLPFQLNEGTSYGSPTSVYGLDPRSCSGNQSATPGVASAYANDADYQTCGASLFAPSGYLAIPNPTTGTFDTLGKYREPWQLNMGLQFGYDVNPRIHTTLTLANVVNRCFGGSSTAWSSAYAPGKYVCAYGGNGSNWVGSQPGAGFFYGATPHDAANGTAGYPNWMNQVYSPVAGGLPFQAYFQVQVKL